MYSTDHSDTSIANIQGCATECDATQLTHDFCTSRAVETSPVRTSFHPAVSSFHPPATVCQYLSLIPSSQPLIMDKPPKQPPHSEVARR